MNADFPGVGSNLKLAIHSLFCGDDLAAEAHAIAPFASLRLGITRQAAENY